LEPLTGDDAVSPLDKGADEGCHLDASFVHLPLPPITKNRTNTVDSQQLGDLNDRGLHNQGILDSYRYLKTMVQIAEQHMDQASTGDWSKSKECLCATCIERMIMAIEESTCQLNAEVAAYDVAIQLEKDKHRRLLRALDIKDGIINGQDDGDGDGDGDDDTIASGNTCVSFRNDVQSSSEYILKKTFEAFEYEIQKLTETHTMHLTESNNLDKMLREQVMFTKALSQEEDEIHRDINSLEIDAKVFQDVHRTLTRQCQEAEMEDYMLRNVRIHSTLFDIQLDERGLRFPLINNLRLTHHPKGVSWLEINAAWSQASQLVMFVGSTTKFQSKDLRIVPLASCAKIIELSHHGDHKKVVNHLGVDFDSNDRKTHETEHIIPSLRAFLAFIYQMSVHMLKGPLNLDKMPYKMGSHYVIGPYDVRKMDEKDDVGWSGVIHCMAYNMKWMAQNACKFLAPI